MKPKAIEPTRHPLSALFERFDLVGEDLQALVDDIKHEGLLNPITTHDGMILDGWNRFQACKLAKARPVFLSLAPGLDPWEFVKGANMLRRHMPPAERLAVMLLKMQMDGGVPNGTPHDPSVKEIEKDLEVGRGTAQRGAQIAKAHDPVLNEALADGRISVDRAAQLAKLPKEERQAAMDSPAPAPGPKPIDDRDARIAQLERLLEDGKKEIAELTQKLQEAGAQVLELHEENASMHRILDAEGMFEEFKREVKRNQERARVAESRRDGLMVENRDLAGRLKSALGRIKRLEKKEPDLAEVS